jgi:hypothetical protein
MLSRCPFLKSPSSKMKKVPPALVQILSPGGARGVFTLCPQLNKTPDDVIEKSANRLQPICSGLLVIVRLPLVN